MLLWHPSDDFFMVGLNLTEDTWYVLSHLTQSMKSMTLQAYTVLMDWVKKQRPGSWKTSVNIICADFVGISRSEFCEIVIRLNAKLWNDDRGEKNDALSDKDPNSVL